MAKAKKEAKKKCYRNEKMAERIEKTLKTKKVRVKRDGRCITWL